jgi:hypothetical protein
MAKRQERKTRIYYAPKKGSFWTVPYSEGKRTIELRRTEKEVREGKPGISIGCMNTLCILHHKKKFPHPVYLAAVTKSVAYVVDKIKDGVPVHAVRYVHNDRYGVNAHDKKGGREWLINSGAADFVLRLKPRKKQGRGGTLFQKANHQGRERVPTIPYGALGRAVEAGLIRKPT